MPNFKNRIQSVDEALRLLTNNNDYIPPCQKYAKVCQPQAHLQRIPQGYQLRLMQGEEYGKVYNLSKIAQRGAKVLTVGRQIDNLIFIKAAFTDYLSRYHCTLEIDENQWVIRDGQWQPSTRQWKVSRNGTFVNSHQVTINGYYLKPGDIIAIGDVTLRFECY